MNIFDTYTGRSQHFPHFARALAGLPVDPYLQINRRGQAWDLIKGDGAYRYDTQRQQLTQFRQQTRHLLSDSLAGLITTPRGQVWFASRQGFSEVDATTGQTSQHAFPLPLRTSQASRLWGATIAGMVVADNGDVVFSDQTQLIVFRPATGQFRLVRLPASHRQLRMWLAHGPGRLFRCPYSSIHSLNGLKKGQFVLRLTVFICLKIAILALG